MKTVDLKRREAIKRQDEYDLLSLKEKKAKASSAPGESKRQLSRLTATEK